MVSSVLHMTAAQLAAALGQFPQTYAGDTEYQDLRKEFPADWPM